MSATPSAHITAKVNVLVFPTFSSNHGLPAIRASPLRRSARSTRAANHGSGLVLETQSIVQRRNRASSRGRADKTLS